MDIIVFGMVITVFTLLQTRRLKRDQSVVTQTELIDDFKQWNSDEARYQIAVAIRRLNRLDWTEIDFSGLFLSDFSFKQHEIESIRGSTFPGRKLGYLEPQRPHKA